MKPTNKPAVIALYGSVKLIEAAIIAAKSQGESYQRELHKIACSVLARVGKNNDVRIVNAFIDSVVDSVRVNALRNWFENYGALKFDLESKLMVYDKSKKTRLGEAMGNAFWAFKAEEAYVPMDVIKAVASLIKRLQKDSVETKRDHSKQIKALELLTA